MALPRQTRHRHFRPLLECLEDRAVPATFGVNTVLDDIVPGNGKQSLREAITRANTSPGADVIVVPAGVFKITVAGAGEDANATGDFDITGSLTIQGAGRGLTIVDGQQLDRVFDVFGSGPGSIKVVLQAATVRNGVVTGPGAGISVGNADLVIRDCAITDNRASGFGGGISNSDSPGTGNVTVVRTTVARNVTGRSGGGISIVANLNGSSVLTLQDSAVRRNSASVVGGGISTTTAKLTNSIVSGNEATSESGGGIFAEKTATLIKCTVSANSSGNGGGGIFADTATLTDCTVSANFAVASGGGIITNTAHLTRCTVNGNSAIVSGGGILATTATLANCTVSGNFAAANGGIGGGGIFVATTATLTNCTVSGNTASSGSGGGINAGAATLTNSTVSGNFGARGGGIDAGTATLTNCTVSGNNSSIGDGGGISAFGATLLNCTIAGNLAHTGGGLFHKPAGGAFSLKNTIVALNFVDFGGSDPDVSGSFASLGHNLIGTGNASFTNGVNGDIVGTSTNPIDPKIGVLRNNGGRTLTHALLAGSPAIDHGDNAGVPGSDQRGAGFPRKKDGDGNGSMIVDIGAFER